jgi:plastocyanin
MRKWSTMMFIALAAASGGTIGRTADTPIGPAFAIAAAAEAPRISIAQFQFGPKTVTVPVGTTVTWVNRDDDAHTVTADDGSFTSAGLDRGEQFSHQFTAPGTYAYHCALHPHMTARVIVK